LTGQPIFNATSLVELCQQHVTAIPAAPSERLGRPVSPQLESALLACLEKNPAKRPQTARDLAALLDRASTLESWSLDDAEAWWGRHERGQAPVVATSEHAAGTTIATGPGGTMAASRQPGTAATSTQVAVSGFDRTILK
jgi:hypothetical protein